MLLSIQIMTMGTVEDALAAAFGMLLTSLLLLTSLPLLMSLLLLASLLHILP
jgi:hypothetical protein